MENSDERSMDAAGKNDAEKNFAWVCVAGNRHFFRVFSLGLGDIALYRIAHKRNSDSIRCFNKRRICRTVQRIGKRNRPEGMRAQTTHERKNNVRRNTGFQRKTSREHRCGRVCGYRQSGGECRRSRRGVFGIDVYDYRRQFRGDHVRRRRCFGSDGFRGSQGGIVEL